MKNNDKCVVSNRLKNARLEKGYDIKVIAEKCGVSCSAMYAYESNNRRPKDNIKKKLSELYGISIQELFYD